MDERELFRMVPSARTAIPWVPLAQLPTPLTTLTVDVPRAGSMPVVIKRDDLTGDLYGGNKVRKLEFLIGQALHAGATRVITAGAFGSHHALATTLHARRAGLDVTAILFPQRITPHVRDIVMMIAGLGADVRFTRRMEFVPVALGRVRRSFGKNACVIPPGGSNAHGTLGYVECGLELARQLRDGNAERPRRVHVAAGTLGTVAGLAIGLALAGEPSIEIAATRITSPLVTNERALRALIKATLALLHKSGFRDARLLSPEVLARNVVFIHDQIGAGYGRATAAGDDAMACFGAAGITLDATYTAKSAAAFLADPLTHSGETMFLHTLSASEPQDAITAASLDDLPREIAIGLKDFNNGERK